MSGKSAKPGLEVRAYYSIRLTRLSFVYLVKWKGLPREASTW